MYLIVDKATQAILHMSNAYPGDDKQAKDLLPGFDAATMDFGRSPEPYIPARFAIEAGVVRDLDAPDERAAPTDIEGSETLSEARLRKLNGFEAQALSQRAQLIPDHQLLNAGLGLYDDERVQALRATVQAFRDEYHRLEAAVAKAKSVPELDGLQPAFPTGLYSRDSSGMFVAAALAPAAFTKPVENPSRPRPVKRGGAVTE